MIVKAYSELSLDERKRFYQFLKEINESLPASSNMWHDDWESKVETLPYILEKTDRFNGVSGEYNILYDNDNIVACGGVYISSFSTEVAIGGVRTWVAKEYRNNSLLREYLLPAHKAWAIERGLSILALTFNDYNKNLIKVFTRRRLGETIDRISTREPKHLFYAGIIEVKIPLKIQYTKQWMIYEQLKDYDFDWKSIEWKND